jgi:nucleoside-diphosphate-sugar epimerase
MNLVIGNTSQQSHYYPDDYIKISSRNIDFNYLKDNKFNNIYITFAEQRIYDNNVDYFGPNVNYTLEIINHIIDNCKKIVVFTSCELWSNLTGDIDVNTPPDFNISNQYTLSKLILLNEIKRLRSINQNFKKIVILHPFYFNSVYRSKYFLFGKIFDSIINKKQITTGCLDFYRDMVHTSFVVKNAINLNVDSVIGSGKLFNVKNFVKDLYYSFNMDFDDYVIEDKEIKSISKTIKAKTDIIYSYENLLNDTIKDIICYKNKK